jgi:hypothetical protein
MSKTIEPSFRHPVWDKAEDDLSGRLGLTRVRLTSILLGKDILMAHHRKPGDEGKSGHHIDHSRGIMEGF